MNIVDLSNLKKQDQTKSDLSDDFAEIYQQLAPNICFYLNKVIGSFHQAQDLTQETFFRAWNSRESFKGKSSVKTWLFTIATNLARDYMKSYSNRKSEEFLTLARIPWTGAGPAEVLEKKEAVKRLKRGIEDLPAEWRAPLLLVKFESMKYREAAEVLGVTLETVRMRIHRAHLALAKALKQGDKS
ncbi:MAG: RNA polymerase sigma factor [Deltaproteobacteria bacterium]|nr:RNA polymerase sigma factor [Deltaproteobacteria bacterium]